jgi:hypothetical protein
VLYSSFLLWPYSGSYGDAVGSISRVMNGDFARVSGLMQIRTYA